MRVIYSVLLVIVLSFSVSAEEIVQEIETVKVKDNIHVLVSPKGGNVVVSSGEDGVFLVDDQLTERSAIVESSVRAITDKEIKFILNTHYHFDHAGGNEHFGSKDAIIVSHNNVRDRLSTEQFITLFDRKMEPLSKEGLPLITFSENMSLHYNDDDIRLIHVASAHTDGDSIVQFVNANVIATGDLVFNGIYPFIDSEHGGSVNGIISGLDIILRIADDKTIIIPGHGENLNKKKLQKYRDMLETIAEKIEEYIFDDKTLEEVLALKPTAKFDKQFGGGFISPETFVTILYEDLK